MADHSRRRGARTWVLLAVDLVLLVLVAIALIGGARDAPARLVEIAAESVGRVEIRGATNVSLEREVDGWVIVDATTRYPARSDRIDPFLDEITAARVERVVTARPARHADLGVGEDARARVVLEARAVRASLLVGDERDGELLVRRAGSDEVVAVRSRLGFYLEQTPSFWAYLRLFPESARPSELVRAQIDPVGDPSIVVSRSGAGTTDWSVTEGGRPVSATQARLSELARDLVDLVGAQFYDGDAETLGIVARLSFELADGRSFSVAVRTDGEVFVAVPAGPGLPGERFGGLAYVISAQRLRRLVALTPDA